LLGTNSQNELQIERTVSFQDSDWTAQAEATAATPPRRTNPYVAAAIGLGIGVAIGATAAIWALQGNAGPDARPLPTQAAATAPHGAASAATAGTGTAPAAAAAASSVSALPAVAVEPLLLPDPPAAAASQPLSAAEVARRKERAWDRFYRRPAVCEGNPSAEQLVECGNHFIRNRREFEERWRAGKL
jgi:hypothetical protein